MIQDMITNARVVTIIMEDIVNVRIFMLYIAHITLFLDIMPYITLIRYYVVYYMHITCVTSHNNNYGRHRKRKVILIF